MGQGEVRVSILELSSTVSQFSYPIITINLCLKMIKFRILCHEIKNRIVRKRFHTAKFLFIYIGYRGKGPVRVRVTVGLD